MQLLRTRLYYRKVAKKAAENKNVISEPDNIARRLTSELSKDTDLQVAVLYGSASSGRMRPDSDLDVAVLYKHSLTDEQRLALIDRLTSTLGRPVDLVDLSTVNGIILQQILCNGKVLLKNSVPSFVRLLQRMVYNQEDMMPYHRRELRERVEKFANAK